MLKFVVDGMLGSLARWLRMLGYEADYDVSVDDDTLLRIMSEKDMILLTRDQELHNRARAKNLASVLVIGESEEERLAQLAHTLRVSLEVDMTRTRCPECGSELQHVEKMEATRNVPEQSLKMYDQYWKCGNSACGKVYWQGSHWRQIHRTLQAARKIASGPE